MFSKKTILAFVSAPILSIIPSTSLEQGYNRLENYPDNSIVHISYGDIVTPKETDKNGKIKIGEKYLTWDGRTAHATRLIGGKECNGQNAIITARHLLPNKIEIEESSDSYLTIINPRQNLGEAFRSSGNQKSAINNLRNLRLLMTNGDFAMVYNLESEKCLSEIQNRLQNPDNTILTISELRTTKNPYFNEKSSKTRYFNPTNKTEAKSSINPEINKYKAFILPLQISNFIIGWYNETLAQPKSEKLDKESLRVALIPKLKADNSFLNPVFMGVSGSPYYSHDNKILGVQSKIVGSLFDYKVESRYTNKILKKLQDLSKNDINFCKQNNSVCSFFKTLEVDSIQLVFMSQPFRQ